MWMRILREQLIVGHVSWNMASRIPGSTMNDA